MLTIVGTVDKQFTIYFENMKDHVYTKEDFKPIVKEIIDLVLEGIYNVKRQANAIRTQNTIISFGEA